ncbi:MAG TPA: hypothetical protein VLE21_00350, partial [Candidatus Nitrosocosmicus sp.]|nr:hypothetical protein [Candidatus Nitrosocosmicus sp.]
MINNYIIIVCAIAVFGTFAYTGVVYAQNQTQNQPQNQSMATITDKPQTVIANQTTVPAQQTTVTVNQTSQPV